MSLRRSTRLATDKPTNHLSDKFVWDSITSSKSTRGADPQPSQRDRTPVHLDSPTVRFTDPLSTDGIISPNEPAASPKAHRTSQRGLLELRLQNESQELEIKKLELQLQLVQLQTSHPTTTSRSDPAAKSLDDLKAPQRTVSPQQWPHIFARGEPKLYNDLLLPEFSTGFLVIVQRCEDPTLQTTLLAHFHDLMVLACNYKWSVVLAFHYKVLRSIEMGLVSWGESFDVLKQPFFLPTALLPEPSPKTALKAAFKLQQALTPRHQICDAWSWHDCSNIPCSKLHICIICKKEHQAFHCPKRKYPVPPRRQDSASTE